MEFETRRMIVLIGLIIVVFSALGIFMALGLKQEPLSLEMILGRIYEAIFGRHI